MKVMDDSTWKYKCGIVFIFVDMWLYDWWPAAAYMCFEKDWSLFIINKLAAHTGELFL